MRGKDVRFMWVIEIRIYDHRGRHMHWQAWEAFTTRAEARARSAGMRTGRRTVKYTPALPTKGVAR